MSMSLDCLQKLKPWFHESRRTVGNPRGLKAWGVGLRWNGELARHGGACGGHDGDAETKRDREVERERERERGR